MTFIILYEDAPDADPDIRKTHMSEHLAFLERNAADIDAAGPLVDVSNQGMDGLWIVSVESKADAERLIREDPFWPTGLRKSYSIIEWRQVFSAGRRLISTA